VRSRKFWIYWGFDTFSKYIESIRDKVDRGRTQVYAIISVAEKLLPSVSEDDLATIGVSKAMELKRIVSQTGKQPSAQMVALAKDPNVTVDSLRLAIFEAHNVKPEHAGTWRDFGGFYATAEEWKELQRGYDIAAKTDPVISKDLPTWAKFKEVQTRLVREYLATYEQQVLRGEG